MHACMMCRCGGCSILWMVVSDGQSRVADACVMLSCILITCHAVTLPPHSCVLCVLCRCRGLQQLLSASDQEQGEERNLVNGVEALWQVRGEEGGARSWASLTRRPVKCRMKGGV